MPLSKTTFRRMAKLQHFTFLPGVFMLSAVQLTAIMLNIVILSGVMLRVFILSVIIFNVVMLHVEEPIKEKFKLSLPVPKYSAKLRPA